MFKTGTGHLDCLISKLNYLWDTREDDVVYQRYNSKSSIGLSYLLDIKHFIAPDIDIEAVVKQQQNEAILKRELKLIQQQLETNVRHQHRERRNSSTHSPRLQTPPR